jgi:hypothetical protein
VIVTKVLNKSIHLIRNPQILWRNIYTLHYLTRQDSSWSPLWEPQIQLVVVDLKLLQPPQPNPPSPPWTCSVTKLRISPIPPRNVTRCVGYTYNLNKLQLREPHSEWPPNTGKKNYPRDNTRFSSKSRKISSDWDNGNITHTRTSGSVENAASLLPLQLYVCC